MEVQNIRIDLISPSPLNPRKTFDEAALEELARFWRENTLSVLMK